MSTQAPVQPVQPVQVVLSNGSGGTDFAHAPYSFSKLSLHRQCNRKFKYQYITKIPQGAVDRTALVKGGAVHSMLEMYPGESTHSTAPLYKHIVRNFARTALGKGFLEVRSTREYRFGLDANLLSSGFYGKNTVFRGSVDVLVVRDGVLCLADYKTGKYKDPRYQEYDQLMMYAVYFFAMYPKINDIRISFVYVEHDLENDIVLQRKYLQNYIRSLQKLITDTELDTEYVKNPSRLCDWCAFKQHCSADT